MKATDLWPDARVLGTSTVRAPGSCGELVQGYLNGAHFHVTCPIDLRSTVTVGVYENHGRVTGPEDCPKSVRAVRLTLEYLNRPELGATIQVESPIPRGKGMASSTADVASAIAATAMATGKSLTLREIAGLALKIEPTDGTMFPGIVLFDHRAGSIYEYLGAAPLIELIVLDLEGMVDTLEFNRADRRAALIQIEGRIQEALDLVRRGIASGDASLIGRGATISAMANQTILSNPRLPSVVEFASEIGALGVNVGHSGTVIGILLDARQKRGEDVLAQISDEFPQRVWAGRFPLAGGGLGTVRDSGPG